MLLFFLQTRTMGLYEDSTVDVTVPSGMAAMMMTSTARSIRTGRGRSTVMMMSVTAVSRSRRNYRKRYPCHHQPE
ncbi:MAG TPA: hypothetical protein VE971_05605 [Candidatus Eisenbacteria bacterium]|nr:hypothetical protein [Candidatus Eisenbacteria bacterium]